jgi:hypothetical protein
MESDMSCIDLPIYGLLCKSDLTVSVLHHDNGGILLAVALSLAVIVGANAFLKRPLR